MSDQAQPDPNALANPAHEIFCVAYAACFNKKKSYREAYPEVGSDDSAAQCGYQLFKQEKIQDRIHQLIEERKRRLELEGDLVIHELMCVAFASLGDYMTLDGEIDMAKLASAPQHIRKAIYSLETNYGPGGSKTTKVKLFDKVRALELVGKTQRIFLERVEEVTNPEDTKVVWDEPVKQEAK